MKAILRALVVMIGAGQLSMAAGLLVVARDAHAADGQLQVAVTILQADAIRVAWSPDGRYIAASIGGEKPGYAVWDARTGTRIRELVEGYGSFLGGVGLAFTADSTHLIVQPSAPSGDPRQRELHFWNVETGAVDARVTGTAIPRSFAASAENNTLAVLYADGSGVLFGGSAWVQVGGWSRPPSSDGLVGASLAVEPSGRRFALGGSSGKPYVGEPRGKIWVYEVTNLGSARQISAAQQDTVSMLAFIGNGGQIASTASQSTSVINTRSGAMEPVRDRDPVRTWNISSGERVSGLGSGWGPTNSLEGSPDGKFLGVASSGTGGLFGSRPAYRIWDVADEVTIGTLAASGTLYHQSAFGPAGDRVAVIASARAGAPFEILIVEFR